LFSGRKHAGKPKARRKGVDPNPRLALLCRTVSSWWPCTYFVPPADLSSLIVYEQGLCHFNK
jgi:hypothetical protein